MANSSEIRDQAYQFFVEEAPELLQAIETGLLALRQERSTAEVHQIMRAAHSLKGGAASVGLDAIKGIAHRLETIFKALYSDSLVIDSDLESQLLKAFDCLRLPLTEQLTQGYFDADQALTSADPVLTALEAQFQQAIAETENYIPSSSDLGINMALSIFETDVGQGLDHLKAVLDHPENHEVAGELRAQADVFLGFAELLSLPGFARIAQSAIQALEINPNQALEIAGLAWADFRAGREAVLAGDTEQGGCPSEALLALGAAPVAADPSDQPEETMLAMTSPLLSEQDSGVLEAELAASEPAAAPPLEPAAEVTADLSFLDLGSAELEAIFAEFESEPSTLPLEQGFPASNTEFVSEPAGYGTQSTETAGDIPLEIAAESLVPSEPLSTESLEAVSETVPEKELIRSQPQPQRRAAVSMTVRVDAERLARMDNALGELTINRNGLSLQNDQARLSLRELLNRCDRVRATVEQLRTVSDQMLIAPERRGLSLAASQGSQTAGSSGVGIAGRGRSTNFDSLEMDSYTGFYTHTQTLLEEMLQLEEVIEDLSLFNRQSEQMLGQHRKMLSQLQDELMWARMLPLGEVLNRFPRILRDLSNAYHKPAELILTGTDLLVDRAVLEKLYDPLLHLLRNGFDHGLEEPALRQQRGKLETGRIEIHASYQGRRILIEVRDDGNGLDTERIRQRVVALGWLSTTEAEAAEPSRLCEFIFQPGFSTATEVSDLSGRGVGLDVVREQLELLKGTVAVQSTPGQGTTFTLSLPLTLSVVNLLVCFVGTTPVALRSDNIAEIVMPRLGQLDSTGPQLMLHWQGQPIPAFRLADLLSYACLVPEVPVSRVLAAVPAPADWPAPMLILKRGELAFALQVDRLVTEQESVIKPFGLALTPPTYAYGCTVLGDGSLIPVIDGRALLETLVSRVQTEQPTATPSTALALTAQSQTGGDQGQAIRMSRVNTVLVVDDAVTSRRLLTLSLERAGYRVLQARDGQEALEQLQQNASVQLVVCDIEMPNMNGFEFLTQRRQDSALTQIPTVMLTSRSNDKHRWLAMQLGATDYFTKPYLEQEFLGAIATHIAAQTAAPVPS
ncbi:MAG TPA: response regulator [Trichocoleus sp.]